MSFFAIKSIFRFRLSDGGRHPDAPSSPMIAASPTGAWAPSGLIAAFGMVEVAIVLVIIGVLAGLSLKGYRLVENAKLKTISVQVEQVRMAAMLFQERYGFLPGDFVAAHEQLQGNLSNGNGDGVISGDGLAPKSEAACFWSHLIAADLMDGITIPRESQVLQLGVHHPASKIGGGLTISGSLVSGARTELGPWLVLGLPVANTGDRGGLTPAQAAEVDMLMDDGNPLTGQVRGITGRGSAATCHEGGRYRSGEKSKACVLYMKL